MVEPLTISLYGDNAILVLAGVTSRRVPACASRVSGVCRTLPRAAEVCSRIRLQCRRQTTPQCDSAIRLLHDTETKLNSRPDLLSFAGFIVIRKDCERDSGGVLAFILFVHCANSPCYMLPNRITPEYRCATSW